MSNKITITISGAPRVGKTAIAVQLLDFLNEVGVPTTFTSDNTDVALVNKRLHADLIFKKIIENGTEVDIVESSETRQA